jgi:hypothetical protein
MVTEPPPQYDASGLPAVADRRAPERRSDPAQRPERVFDARTAIAVGAALCGGLVLVFVFFWALGAVDVTDAMATTSVVLLLALVWLVVYLYRSRQEESDVIRRDRERRGF